MGASIETFRAATGPRAANGFGLLTLVPPAAATPLPSLPRDLVVLLDTSGSMSGEPLDQARHVVSALVDSLGGEDTLELIEFSDAPRRWKREPVRVTLEARRSALAWLAKLEAGGSTEMREAIVEALQPLRQGAQRQVVLVTDGCIGFESEVVAEVLARLPGGSRLHTLGVGSSVNCSLTAPAARAGRGTECIVGLGEDPERAAHALVAHTATPLVTNLTITGDAVIGHAPARLPDLFGGSPALVALRLRAEGGDVRVSGDTPGGKFERTVHIRPLEAGAGEPRLAALFGREAVEDLETRLAAGERAQAIDAAIEKLGLDLQISTRLTSWVAISEEPTVDPRAPTRRVKVPHGLPYGMSVEGLGLRRALASRAVVMACPPSAAGFNALYQEAIAPLKRFDREARPEGERAFRRGRVSSRPSSDARVRTLDLRRRPAFAPARRAGHFAARRKDCGRGGARRAARLGSSGGGVAHLRRRQVAGGSRRGAPEHRRRAARGRPDPPPRAGARCDGRGRGHRPGARGAPGGRAERRHLSRTGRPEAAGWPPPHAQEGVTPGPRLRAAADRRR